MLPDGAPMRVLLAHTHYQQRGGEDACFAAEADLLEAHGHEVERFSVHNASIAGLGRLDLAAKTIWNREAYRELRRRIRARRPSVVHAHNLFPLMSPAIYYAAAAEGVPVVQTVHNYRLLCVGAGLFRDGRPCEDCLTRVVPWPGVLRGCYRGSRTLSGGVAAMLGVHRALGSWQRRVQVLVAISGFLRDKLVEGGLPAGRIVVKPNFLPVDPGEGAPRRDGHVLFVGRLAPEKGPLTLIDAWSRIEAPLRLKIVGDGPIAGQVAARAAADPRIELLGQSPPGLVRDLMRNAAATVVPSEWYEPFGLVVIESFAVGTPVLAARSGALASMVEDGRTGMLFRPGDPADLAARLLGMLRDEAAYRAMCAAARAEFLARYTASANHETLMRIYAQAEGRSAPAGGAPGGR